MGKQYEEIDLNDADADALSQLEEEMSENNIKEPKVKDEPRMLMSGQESYEPDDDYEVEIVDETAKGKDSKEAAPKEEKPKEAEQVAKKQSRAQKRITRLAQQKNELAEKLQEAEKKNFELEEKYNKSRNSSAKSQRDMTAKRLQGLEHSLLRAAEESDWKAHAAITREISDTNLRLRVLDYEANNVPVERQYEAPVQQQGIPEAAQAWLEDNAWMNDPAFAGKRQMTERVADELMRRGFSPEDDAFYDELDTALEVIEKNWLEEQAKQKAKESNEEEEVTQEDHSAQPSLQGRGRQAPRRPSRRKVRLTADEKEMADTLGVAYDEYAKEVDKYNEGGWTEL